MSLKAAADKSSMWLWCNDLVLCLSVVFSGFLSSVASQQDGAMSRAERGEVTLSQVGEL